MSEQGPTDRLRQLGIAAWSIVGSFAVLAIFVWLIVQVRIIWPPLIFAVILVFLFKPLVDRLEARRIPRVVGGCLSYLLFGGVLVALGIVAVPAISSQTVDLVEQFPALVDTTSETVSDWAQRFNFPIGVEGVESVSTSIREWFADPANREVILEGLGQVGEIARGVLEVLVIALLAPVLAFYIIVDARNLGESAERLIPDRNREEVLHVGRQVARAVSGFIRGQLVVALIVGSLSSAVLYALDLPFWLIVGLTAGLLNIVPFIGPWVGGALGVATALISGNTTTAIWVAIAFLIIQQIDNHIISPMVLRVAVRLGPATIILALLAGGSIGGLFGVLIAVPLTAVVKIIGGHLWRTRVLGESWDEVVEAMMVEYEPEPLKERLRRGTPIGKSVGQRFKDGEGTVLVADAVADAVADVHALEDEGDTTGDATGEPEAPDEE